jgi:hypothetical protein
VFAGFGGRWYATCDARISDEQKIWGPWVDDGIGAAWSAGGVGVEVEDAVLHLKKRHINGTLGEQFPILEAYGDCIVSKMRDVTVGLVMQKPGILSLSSEHYDEP